MAGIFICEMIRSVALIVGQVLGERIRRVERNATA
jgi:hypothetical protein